MIKIIVALGKNRLIGKDNSLPWHIKSDLQHFKKQTTGHDIIMGEKTYLSMGGKPLPNRHSIVLTLQEDFDPNSQEVEIRHDLNEVVNQYKNSGKDLYVIGGAQIYKLFLPYTDEMIVSYIKGDYTGNIFFPEFENDFIINKEEDYEEFKVCYYKRK